VERVVFVHGSVTGAAATWRGQQPLDDRFELVLVERPGYPPGTDVERVDFEQHAALVANLLETGDHLVGHSYGGVITLLAAAARPDALRSLTLIEPPATRVAPDDPAVAAFAENGRQWWATGPKHDPEAFLRGFLHTVGSSYDPPSPLPPDVALGARTLIVERGPWEAEIPLDELAVAPFPKLVVSGSHHAAFDGICDVLQLRLSAEHVVLPGYGHTVQRHPDFNTVLSDFVERASQRRA
jgi:pimeloyl-ACP methyl ester carboxylesterase